ncbi:hypothetical protein RI367_001093 [Sorochytrium milnesiophthora]
MTAAVVQKSATPELLSHSERRLRRCLLVYLVGAFLFFVLSIVNLSVRVLGRQDDFKSEAASSQIDDVVVEPYRHLISLLSSWAYPQLCLDALGAIMSLVGFFAVYKIRVRVLTVYMVWAALHAIAYLIIMGYTLHLAVQLNSFHERPTDAYAFGIAVLLPDFAVWSFVRFGVLYAVYAFWCDIRMYSRPPVAHASA